MNQCFIAKPATPKWDPSFRRFITNRDEGIRGIAAVEFAMVASSLVLMMICVADVGTGFYRRMQVQNAAQSGAQYAMLHGYSSSSITSAVTAATSFAGISAAPAPTQFCGCPSSSGITTASPASPPCSTCADGSAAGTYVLVSAQGT